jgi:PAS domain S-box-containing protein
VDRSATTEREKALFDNALDAILLANDDGAFVDANPAACELLGRSREQILTMSIWDVRPRDRAEELRTKWRAFLATGSLSGDDRIVLADGSARDVECRAVANVSPGLHLSILRYVTARNQARSQAEHGLLALNEQLRRVSARASARREEDRTRLARELHDQLGQALAALKIDLCWLGQQVETGSVPTEELSAKVQAMTRLADETIFRVRRISSELRPPVLDRLGLVAAIEWQIDEFRKRSGIHVRLRSRLEHLPLDLGRSTAVFRIFQEALSNVATHAQATQVTVRFSMPRQRFVLAVADNGRGIPSDQEAGRALGLVGMRERAALLGGTLHIRPGRTHGTIVSMSIPLAERRRTSRDPSL